MARRAAAPQPYQYVLVGNDIVQTATLSAADLQRVRGAERDGNVRCPTCRGRMALLMDSDGAVAVHRAPNPYAGHEPEDPDMRKAKRLIAARMQAIFPSAPVDLDVHMPEIDHLADVVVVTPFGGRIAVEVQHADITPQQVAGLRDRYESVGVRCLWLLDGRRLRTTKTPAPELQIFKAMLEGVETGLIALNEPVVYLDSTKREIVWVRPSRAVRELAALGDKRVGRVECLVRGYPLAQLRVREGGWWVPTHFDPKPPKPPALPANLIKRLDRLREKASA